MKFCKSKQLLKRTEKRRKHPRSHLQHSYYISIRLLIVHIYLEKKLEGNEILLEQAASETEKKVKKTSTVLLATLWINLYRISWLGQFKIFQFIIDASGVCQLVKVTVFIVFIAPLCHIHITVHVGQITLLRLRSLWRQFLRTRPLFIPCTP